MSLRRTAVTLALTLCAVALGAGEPGDFIIANARSAALGGPHIAHADDFFTLHVNPAGLRFIEPRFTYAALSAGASGPVFTLAGIMVEGVAGADLSSLLASPAVQDVLQGIHARAQLSGPLAFGFAGGGAGFGVYNDTALTVRATGSSGIEIRLGERFLLRGGYGFEVPTPSRWNARGAVGVGVKGFVRGDSVLSTSLVTLPSLADSIGPDLLSESPFEIVSGLGIDVGLMLVWRDQVGAAVTLDNLYSPNAVIAYTSLDRFLESAESPPTTYDRYPRRLNVGLAYTPSLGTAERYVQDLRVLLDYRDVLDFWTNPAEAENVVLKFGAGVEATFLRILSLRAGFSRGLPAAGLGLDLGFVRLQAAMFGTELSREPGLRPAYNLLVGLEFGQ